MQILVESLEPFKVLKNSTQVNSPENLAMKHPPCDSTTVTTTRAQSKDGVQDIPRNVRRSSKMD